jgi:isoleucyl-tRNA synthetase
MTDQSATDYKDTVFLPETAFPMRGELPKREPQMLERWRNMDLFGKLRARAAGRPKFVLHDGPPYANGNLHIGHALNKILKDVINRVHQMKGEDANYVPGWDCHGLPIEWKIEEEYRAKGKDKDAVPIVEFRKECRDFAAKWIDIQRAEFKRLGIEGNWSNPYATMTFPAEAQIVREIHRFALNGGLYRGARPVMWSVVEKTALAEAETARRTLLETGSGSRLTWLETKQQLVEAEEERRIQTFQLAEAASGIAETRSRRDSLETDFRLTKTRELSEADRAAVALRRGCRGRKVSGMG